MKNYDYRKLCEQGKDQFKNKERPNSTFENAKKYLQSTFQNTYYLGYRDIPDLIKKYNLGKKAIDYGCGVGRSTRFLNTLGFDVVGVDISQIMLSEAVNQNDGLHYFLIRNSKIPVINNTYDLFFSCFVFFTVPSIEELRSIFKEAYRCLKKDGFFIFVTGSECLYSYEWLSYNVAYPENKDLKSGSKARIQLADLNIEFVNYLWTDSDYKKLASDTKFKILETHFPLGRENEFQWASETKHPPYAIYILQK